jgi:hypothetical protein
MSTADELLTFFSPPSEPKSDLIQFNYNPFDDEEVETKDKEPPIDGVAAKLNKVLKDKQIIRVRPDISYYEDWRGQYDVSGNVWFEGKLLTLFEFVKAVRGKVNESARSDLNPLKYCEAYVEGQWHFLIRLLNPKAAIPQNATIYSLFDLDLRLVLKTNDWCINSIDFSERRKQIRCCWEELPTPLKLAYEQKLRDIYYKETQDNTCFLPFEHVKSYFPSGTKLWSRSSKDSHPIKYKPHVYMLFSKEKYEEFKKKYPTLKITELSKKIGEAWACLSTKEKEIWHAKAPA